VEGIAFPPEYGANMKKPVVIILLVVALLFVLAGIGAILFFTVTVAGGELTISQSLVSATAEESKTLKVEGPVTLKVFDDTGAVTVVGADVDTVQVEVVKTAHAPTQARAEEELKEIKYEIRQAGNAITLKYDIPNTTVNNFPNVTVISPNYETVDFIVTVPNETTVDVEAGAGEVSVTSTHGEVSIASSFGDVTLENIEGKLTVDTQSGQVDASSINAGSSNIDLSSEFGKVSLEKASGKDIRLHSQSGALEMTNVRASGRVDMSTDFGDTLFNSGSADSLIARTSSGKVILNTLNLDGALTAESEFGEISVEQVKATSYDLQTDNGSITADGVLGKVKAHSGFGSVTVKNADSVTLDLSTQSGRVDFEGSLGEGPHTIHSDFGEISITIPADSALNVDLKTDFGKIKSEIPITVIFSGDDEEGRQTGTTNEGGDQLTVETQNGSITIRASK
jgi:flagellar basal body-associated protein FliL